MQLPYSLARAALFRLSPEHAHDLALSGLKSAAMVGATRCLAPPIPTHPVEVMGLRFANPCGLAAGLDKNGDYIDALGALGFGFIEVGTVTPQPQPGNPKPRMFRIVPEQALINRLGFNNKGVDHLVAQATKRRYRGVLGINIGKNKNTTEANAIDDYVVCLRKVYPHADYVTVNISSPNTAGLRDLQRADLLNALLSDLKSEQAELASRHQRRVPLAIKLAPDLEPDSIAGIAGVLNKHQVDAVISGNTTVTRPGLNDYRQASEAGGLSGAPLLRLANQTLSTLR